MPSNDINDLLDTIRKELPGRAQGAFEEAAKRAMRQNRHHRRGRGGFDWETFERSIMPPMWQKRNQRQDEGLLPLLTLIIGFIGGAALMYLFDPDRGARRRAMIQVEARKLANEAEEKVEETAGKVRAEVERVVNEAEDKAGEVAGEVRAEVNRVAGEASDKAEEVRAGVKRVAGEAADKAEEVRDDVKKAVDDTKKPAGTS